MTVQRVAGAMCVVAGVAVLVGLGWALLAAGTFLWAGSHQTDLATAGRKIKAMVEQGRTVVAAVPRRVAAVSSMTVGMVAVPAGVAMTASIGLAVVVAGGLMLGVSLLTGWGA